MRAVSCLILAVTIGVPAAAHAGLRVCNDTDNGLRVALGYQDQGTWTSEGWWTVDSGACAMVIGTDLNKRFYYWRAESDAGDFATGGYAFCTGPSPFTITGDADCPARGFASQRFHEIELAPGTRRHTLVLGPGDLQTPADTPGQPPSVPQPVASFTDRNAAAPGTHGEPFTVSGLLSHCEVTDAGQQCEIHADGWRYVADLAGPTAVALIEWLADLPESTPIHARGDMKSYGGTVAEVTLRHVELTGPDAFASQRAALRGFWTSLDDASYQMLIYGSVAEEMSGGVFVETSMLDVAQTCDGALGDGPHVILRSFDEEREPRCMSLDLLSLDRLELWPLGVMRPLRFSRTD